MVNKIKAELISWWGPGDRRISESAWCSTYDRDKFEDKTEEQIDKVLDIVVKQHHGTPAEAVWLEFYIECPIYIERQYDKEALSEQYQDFQIEYLFRGADLRPDLTQNELSGRYRSISNRYPNMPNDVAEIMCDSGYENLGTIKQQENWQTLMDSIYNEYACRINALKNAFKNKLITQEEYKRAREFVRGILPLATFTHMKVIMNLRAFEKVMNNRLASDAQVEARELAQLMLQEVISKGVAPKTIEKMISVNNWNLMHS